MQKNGGGFTGMRGKKEKKIYTLYTQGEKPIEYKVSFADEPEDWSQAAKLFTMMAKDLAKQRVYKNAALKG